MKGFKIKNKLYKNKFSYFQYYKTKNVCVIKILEKTFIYAFNGPNFLNILLFIQIIKMKKIYTSNKHRSISPLFMKYIYILVSSYLKQIQK